MCPSSAIFLLLYSILLVSFLIYSIVIIIFSILLLLTKKDRARSLLFYLSYSYTLFNLFSKFISLICFQSIQFFYFNVVSQFGNSSISPFFHSFISFGITILWVIMYVTRVIPLVALPRSVKLSCTFSSYAKDNICIILCFLSASRIVIVRCRRCHLMVWEILTNFPFFAHHRSSTFNIISGIYCHFLDKHLSTSAPARVYTVSGECHQRDLRVSPERCILLPVLF